MVIAIFTLILLSTISLIISMVLGYLVHSDLAYLNYHVAIGLPAILLVLFTHSMILFYFIGTGKTLKEATLENSLSKNYIVKTKVFKQLTFPPTTFTILGAITLACLGGATQMGNVPSNWHEMAAWGTLFLHLWASIQEIRCIIANQLLANDAVQEINVKRSLNAER